LERFTGKTADLSRAPSTSKPAPVNATGDVSRGRIGGVLLLALVTVIWGTTFILTRWLETDATAPLPPSMLVLLRFVLAALLCSPALLSHGRNKRLWLAGAELGFWLWCGYASQAVGLATTTVGRSAFITSLNVVFVPALAAVGGRRVSTRVWAAAALALIGTGLLCNDGGRPNAGDGWTLLTAATYAVYIVRLEGYTSRFGSMSLTVVQLWAVALFSAGWVGAELLYGLSHGTARMDFAAIYSSPAKTWAQLVYLGIVATALTTLLQAIGQKSVPGPQASLLYTLEPVWAALFAWLGSREGFGQAGWAGAALIFAAAIGSQWPTRGKPSARRRTPCDGAGSHKSITESTL
jgi:drug/metabolite transporter (DMT)-like permease